MNYPMQSSGMVYVQLIEGVYMCGAARFAVQNMNDPYVEALDVSTVSAQTTVAETRFWGITPVLPVLSPSLSWQLVRWGNRNDHPHFPAGGWAQQESIHAGKWARFAPQSVTIPLIAGYEQGVWFTIRTGARGIVVGQGADARVYMVTEAADEVFWHLTHHPRRPSLIDQTDYPVLPGSRQQLGLWE